ncbi:hypothetical protein DPMN_021351 [Dreissena polymorpha]|uniref:Uncharacterized protein n=1 Tax=Dreissena polymorpha TaxID=45954 RepID=A0A9D4S9W4_DREPO|nr:hypothetical protein DPMN_021351 [Dreissena polymorpha]
MTVFNKGTGDDYDFKCAARASFEVLGSKNSHAARTVNQSIGVYRDKMNQSIIMNQSIQLRFQFGFGVYSENESVQLGSSWVIMNQSSWVLLSSSGPIRASSWGVQ